MHLHRDLADAQLGGNLLVQHAAYRQRQHLVLARGEGHVALLQGVVLFIARGVVFRQLKRGLNGVDKRYVEACLACVKTLVQAYFS